MARDKNFRRANAVKDFRKDERGYGKDVFPRSGKVQPRHQHIAEEILAVEDFDWGFIPTESERTEVRNFLDLTV